MFARILKSKKRHGASALLAASVTLAAGAVFLGAAPDAQAWFPGAYVISRERGGELQHRPQGRTLRKRIPFGVYVRDSGYARRRAALDLLIPAKIDIVSSGWGSSNTAKSQIDELIRRCRNANTIWFYDMFDGPNLDQQTTDPNFNRKGFANSNGLGAWLHGDDADILYSGALINANELAIRTYEPAPSEANIQAATMITISGSPLATNGGADFWAGVADILGGQWYPIVTGNRRAFTTYYRMRNLVRSCKRGGSIPLAILQLSGNPAQTSGNNITQPNAKEMGIMAHLSLAAGVKGILWYGFESRLEQRLDRKDNDLWVKLVELRRQVQDMEKTLLQSAPNTQKQPNFHFYRSVWGLSNGDRMVALINAEPNDDWTGINVNIGQTNRNPILKDALRRQEDGRNLHGVRGNFGIYRSNGSGFINRLNNYRLPRMTYRVFYVDVPPYLNVDPWER